MARIPRFARPLIAVCLLAVLAGPHAAPCAAGEDTPAAPLATVARRIGLAEALAAADRLPELIAAQAEERAAEARVRVAGAIGQPDLTIQTNSITARQEAAASIPIPIARGPRVNAARAEVSVAQRSRAEIVAAARREVRVAWFSLAAAEERDKAATERATRAQRNSDAIEALFEASRVARIDAVRARAELALARAERESADQERVSAASRLGLLLDPEAVGDIETTGPIEPGPEPDLQPYLARAQKASPAVRTQEAQAAAAAARFDLARRERWPAMALNGGARWNDPTQPGTDSWIGLGFGFPFGSHAAADAASAEGDREAAGLLVARRQAAEAAQAAWRSARSARLRFEAVDTDGVPAAREAAELTRLAYKEGRADLFRVLDAERALTEVLTVRADALEAWGVAFADLKALEGDEAGGAETTGGAVPGGTETP
jgi:cobalt-zinc-cadmium efflux system outer membrane protein